jgi:kynurenine formamidase
VVATTGVGEPNNWGRWGPGDGRGTLNLLTEETVSAALAVKRAGRVFMLGSSVGKRGVITDKRNATWHVTTAVQTPGTEDGRAEDVIMMHTHAHTHIDGLGHVWFDGKLFNGVSASRAVGRGGTKHAGVEDYGGVIGEAVVLDVTDGRDHLDPGHAISAAELEAAEQRAGVDARAADIILIRTGWTTVFDQDRKLFHSGSPGLSPDGAAWVAEREPAVLGMDVPAVEPVPPPQGVHPLACHRLFLWQLGTPLIENMQLDELAREGVSKGLFMLSPLLIKGGLGSPVNPLLVV